MRVFAALLNVEIAEDLGRGDKLDDQTFVTNNKREIARLLKPQVIEEIGQLEKSALTEAGAVIYSAVDLPDDASADAAHAWLRRKLDDVQRFKMALWLVKDNCVDSELGFLLCWLPQGGLRGHSNFLGTVYSLATGRTEVTSFSRDELRRGRQLFRRMSAPAAASPFTRLTTNVPRVARASCHLSIARGYPDLGLKLSSYCSAFEALFSTSTAELSHQLAERVALFLSNSSARRLQDYRTIKSAYTIRSKVAHGDAIKPGKAESLPELASRCDSLLRDCLEKVISDRSIFAVFEGDSEQLEEYMLARILGARSLSE